MRVSPGRWVAVGTVSAIVALLSSPACSSGGATTDGGGDGASGGDSSTGTGGAASTSKGGSSSTGKGGSGGTSSSKGGAPAAGGSFGVGVGGALKDAGPDLDAFFANDPPPMSCDGGAVTPPTPGGTPDCPDDKNRQGCPCPNVGTTAACWPGFRKDRHHGLCKDGMTTCTASGEVQVGAWGPCVGYVLPDPNVKSGPASCKCFSGGSWKLDNLSPCFVGQAGQEGMDGALSTIDLGGGKAMCPSGIMLPLTPPPTPWAKDTLTVDCAGHFRLCYTLKAGDGKMPLPTDCVVTKVCAEADYTKENVAQPFPDLPGWATTGAAEIACAQKFAQSGGYGEMSVQGISIECDMVDDHVFNRVIYCPLSCNTNPTGPGCMGCMNGGGGTF